MSVESCLLVFVMCCALVLFAFGFYCCWVVVFFLPLYFLSFCPLVSSNVVFLSRLEARDTCTSEALDPTVKPISCTSFVLIGKTADPRATESISVYSVDL